MKTPIPCSVSLLTLNAEDGLRDCLESLKDFEEIIICDGNSTDGTAAIAEEYGARIMKQYDTDEPNVPCASDKATVRQRAMSASVLPWRFFMDADDTLSSEVVNEIRTIVTDPDSSHLIWRMPTRVFIDGKEILYEATYPSYQTRLVHESVGARFKGPVHDHLVWDAKKFPVGTLANYYNFHWSKERVKNYWKYTYTYIQRELNTMGYHRMSFANFLRWGVYFRLRVFFGYVLWRLPQMYLRHGFKHSMPIRLEAMIAFQHLYLLVAGAGRFIASRAISMYVVHALRGTFSETRRDLVIRDWDAYGRVLDLGPKNEDYWKYLDTTKWNRVMHASIEALPSETFDTILCLENLTPCADFVPRLVSLLRPGGKLIATAADMPNENELINVEVWRIGRGYVFRAVKQ